MIITWQPVVSGIIILMIMEIGKLQNQRKNIRENTRTYFQKRRLLK